MSALADLVLIALRQAAEEGNAVLSFREIVDRVLQVDPSVAVESLRATLTRLASDVDGEVSRVGRGRYVYGSVDLKALEDEQYLGTLSELVLAIVEDARASGIFVLSLSSIVEAVRRRDGAAEPASIRTAVSRLASENPPKLTRFGRGGYALGSAIPSAPYSSEALSAVTKALENLISQAKSAGLTTLPDGYRSSAFALVDAVFSISAHYSSVRSVIEHVKERLGVGDDEDFTITVLAGHLAGKSDEELMSFFGNASRIARSGIPKARVVRNAAQRLLTLPERDARFHTALDRRDDFLQVTSGGPIEALPRFRRVERDLLQVEGLGVATIRYLFLLLGAEMVKPDRMVVRWVRDAVDPRGGNQPPGPLPTPEVAAALLEEATRRLQESHPDLTIREVDHLVWLVASRRALRPATAASRVPGETDGAVLALGAEVDLARRKPEEERWHGRIVGFDQRGRRAIVEWLASDTNRTMRFDGRGDLTAPCYSVELPRDLIICTMSEDHPQLNNLRSTASVEQP